MAHDTDSLTPAPVPSAEARERALAAALARFDAAHGAESSLPGQASAGPVRRKERRSPLGGPLMLRTRPLVAATLVAALAVPTAWTILRERAPETPPAPEKVPAATTGRVLSIVKGALATSLAFPAASVARTDRRAVETSTAGGVHEKVNVWPENAAAGIATVAAAVQVPPESRE